MKPKIYFLFLYTFFALICFTSCQDEAIEIIDPNEQENIVPNSSLANLIQNTTSNDGSSDDFLDGSSCFSIELPVTVMIDNITVVIDDEDDLDDLEDLVEDYLDADDFLEFTFPITVIFSDYTELVIENADQLEALIVDCDDSVDEDIIECVDFQYPISFSVLNSEFVIINTVEINDDGELYDFLESLDDDDDFQIVSLNYPVTLEYANGDTVEVNSNQELSDAIEAAEDDCNDDNYNCNEENISELLVECPWDIDDEFNDFDNFQIVFNEDGTLQINEGDATFAVGGEWTLNTTDNGLILILSELTAYQDDFGGEWLISECDDDDIEIVRGDGFEIELEQDCSNDTACEYLEIFEELQECYWRAEFNGDDHLQDYELYFNENGELVVLHSVNDGVINATWEFEVDASGAILLTMIFDPSSPLTDLDATWHIVECDDDDELYFTDSTNTLKLEQECTNDNSVFDCFGDFELQECADENGEAVFNLSANTIGLTLCEVSFIPSFHTTEQDAENDINAIVNTETYVSSDATVYLRIESGNGNYEVYDIQLDAEDCDQGTCNVAEVDDYLQTCIWNVVIFNGDDHLVDFDLDFASGDVLNISDANSNTYNGYWNLTATTEGLQLELANINGPNIQEVSGYWLLVECAVDRLEFVNIDTQAVMVMEQNCD